MNHPKLRVRPAGDSSDEDEYLLQFGDGPIHQSNSLYEEVTPKERQQNEWYTAILDGDADKVLKFLEEGEYSILNRFYKMNLKVHTTRFKSLPSHNT